MKPWNLPNITIYTTKVQWVLRFIVIGQLIEVKHEITVIRPLSSLIDFVTSFINRKNLSSRTLRTETLTVFRLAATMIAGHNINLSLQYRHRKAKCLHDFHHLRASRCFPC